MAGAIDYTLGHWTVLTHYLGDGAVAIDNNHLERQIKPWAMGRWAWLFAGSELAGLRTAMVMSLVQSARINGHERSMGIPARRAGAPPDAAQQPDRGLAAAQMSSGIRRGTMTLLTQDVMVQANIDVNRMSAQQKVQLTDEIYVQQPNLLASILVLPRYGVDMQLLEEPIHVLLVAFQAMKHCGNALPTISEDVQETGLQRLTATMKFSEGVSPDLVEHVITKFCVDHPECCLLAFVYGPLG